MTSSLKRLWQLSIAAAITIALVGLCVHRADGATVSGTLTHATKYEDGQDLGTNLKHTRVEVGTCTATAAFGTKEGEALVVPPTTTWSVTLARQFGDFCARGQSETVSGLLSTFTTAVKVTKVEPKPNPPVLTAVNVLAYEVKLHPVEGTMLGRNVGTVPLGTKCDEPVAVYTSQGEFHGVPLEAVTLKPAFEGKLKSETIVALCEVAG